MGAKVVDGWLEQVSRCPSPNCNERPRPQDISLLVIHNISLPPGEFGGDDISALFCNELDCAKHASYDSLRGVQVSAHLLIDRQGALTQFVAFDARAWHAGVSSFEERDNCNDFSIGIELEGTDDQSYTDAQYQALIEVTESLQHSYPAISTDRIVGHCDIAPGRKTDPGPSFDWQRYLGGLRQQGAEQ